MSYQTRGPFSSSRGGDFCSRGEATGRQQSHLQRPRSTLGVPSSRQEFRAIGTRRRMGHTSAMRAANGTGAHSRAFREDRAFKDPLIRGRRRSEEQEESGRRFEAQKTTHGKGKQKSAHSSDDAIGDAAVGDERRRHRHRDNGDGNDDDSDELNARTKRLLTVDTFSGAVQSNLDRMSNWTDARLDAIYELTTGSSVLNLMFGLDSKLKKDSGSSVDAQDYGKHGIGSRFDDLQFGERWKQQRAADKRLVVGDATKKEAHTNGGIFNSALYFLLPLLTGAVLLFYGQYFAVSIASVCATRMASLTDSHTWLKGVRGIYRKRVDRESEDRKRLQIYPPRSSAATTKKKKRSGIGQNNLVSVSTLFQDLNQTSVYFPIRTLSHAFCAAFCAMKLTLFGAVSVAVVLADCLYRVHCVEFNNKWKATFPKSKQHFASMFLYLPLVWFIVGCSVFAYAFLGTRILAAAYSAALGAHLCTAYSMQSPPFRLFLLLFVAGFLAQCTNSSPLPSIVVSLFLFPFSFVETVLRLM